MVEVVPFQICVNDKSR